MNKESRTILRDIKKYLKKESKWASIAGKNEADTAWANEYKNACDNALAEIEMIESERK